MILGRHEFNFLLLTASKCVLIAPQVY